MLKTEKLHFKANFET